MKLKWPKTGQIYLPRRGQLGIPRKRMDGRKAFPMIRHSMSQ